MYEKLHKKEIRKRKRLHKSAKRQDTQETWNTYRIQRNKVISLIRKAKDDYYKSMTDKLNDPIRNTKQWWHLCKFIYSGKVEDHSIPPILSNDSIFTKDADKANIFNDYFTSISNIDETNLSIPSDIPFCASTLHNIHISETDVTDIIKSVKTNKACGPDKINHKILKEALPVIVKPLSDLFNLSLSTATFPRLENSKCYSHS